MKELLTTAEKEYLKAVIKPFRESITAIVKYHSNYDGDYISFLYNHNKMELGFRLPYFETYTMYKGMEIEKKYTLEDLNL